MIRADSKPRRFHSARRIAGACLLPLLKQAARAYVAGDTLDDARQIARRFAAENIPCTIGYFDSDDDDTPQTVLYTYLAALRAIADTNDYLSIKLPSLGFRADLLEKLAIQAAPSHIRLHFDALGPESVDPTRDCIDRLLRQSPASHLGFTLVGRWRRSLVDAHWAVTRGLSIRVVKGQWADPHDPARDLRQGYLKVIDQLAGRARHVAVASHDVPMTRQALQRLQEAGTSCELELLFGLPLRQSLALARHMNIPIRIYIPYGKTHLPYAVGKVLTQPRLAWWLFKDLLSSAWPARASA
jgi:proline dehydrogenase